MLSQGAVVGAALLSPQGCPIYSPPSLSPWAPASLPGRAGPAPSLLSIPISRQKWTKGPKRVGKKTLLHQRSGIHRFLSPSTRCMREVQSQPRSTVMLCGAEDHVAVLGAVNVSADSLKTVFYVSHCQNKLVGILFLLLFLSSR